MALTKKAVRCTKGCGVFHVPLTVVLPKCPLCQAKTIRLELIHWVREIREGETPDHIKSIPNPINPVSVVREDIVFGCRDVGCCETTTLELNFVNCHRCLEREGYTFNEETCQYSPSNVLQEQHS